MVANPKGILSKIIFASMCYHICFMSFKIHMDVLKVLFSNFALKIIGSSMSLFWAMRWPENRRNSNNKRINGWKRQPKRGRHCHQWIFFTLIKRNQCLYIRFSGTKVLGNFRMGRSHFSIPIQQTHYSYWVCRVYEIHKGIAGVRSLKHAWTKSTWKERELFCEHFVMEFLRLNKKIEHTRL